MQKNRVPICKKSRFPKAEPLVAHRNERNTLSCEARFSGELPYLLALCKKSGVPVFLFDIDYTIAEREQMQKFADEILQRGLFPG